ncbi:MAG: hypothetical protein B6226_01100 [Candidatus Cloacimonetes bacterium 4572_65]|nr:MAG: hypothetical protein B6226_01100 [Candidatus Cloacimonetes bacterium 4572_65]
MKLVMAPMLTITDAKFRNVYNRYFPDFDYAITPFVSFPDGNNITSKANSFRDSANYLKAWGYGELNLNLACPAKTVVNKGRGASYLNQPDNVDRVLNDIFTNVDNEVSIKIRSGRYSFDEFSALAKVLNKYPLKNITLHARTAVQGYTGKVNLDSFAEATDSLKGDLIFSGDINHLETYKMLEEKFPSVSSWMIGRGFLANPFLPRIIKDGSYDCVNKERLIKWHRELFDIFFAYGYSQFYVLGRMKNSWKYLSRSFSEGEEFLKSILPCLDADEFIQMTERFLVEKEFRVDL